MQFKEKIIVSIVAILATVFLIYLTPLKNLNLIEPRINTVSPKTFYEAYTKNPNGFIFIDVRSESSYNKMHAVGAINIPLHLLYDERHNLPKHGKIIALICGGNRASRVGYGYLEHYGFLNLTQIEGGIEKWQEADLPVVTGD